MNSDYYFIGDNRRAISGLQRRLRLIAKFDKDIPSVFVDGIYGFETRSAVRAFQLKNSLPPNGITDFVTFTEIVSQYARLVSQTDNFGVRPDFSTLLGGSINPGERSYYVYALKSLLSRISELDENFHTELNNFFDPETERAVRLLQEILGYTPDGIVTLELWKDLLDLTNRQMY